MKKRFRLWLLPIPALLLGCLGLWLHLWGRADRAQSADAIVIFGASVRDGGHASPILRARTRHGFELWQRGLAPKIVCTGGVGTFPPAESEVQKRLLIGWGVPQAAILVDDKSTSTLENARNAASLLPRGARVIAVSEPFHLWRCCRNCSKFGLTAFPSPDIDGWNALRGISKAFYIGREAIVVLRDLVL